MNLDEVIEVMLKAIKENKKVARVHTGDPVIFGAHREQMDILDNFYGIDYEVTPSFIFFGIRCCYKKNLPCLMYHRL